MTKLMVFGVWLSVSAGPLMGSPVEWPTSEGGNGHFYEAVLMSATYAQAEKKAAAAGGHLATIGSAGENDVVFSLIDEDPYWKVVGADTRGPWIGGVLAADSWGWVDGSSWSFTSWANGEPNGAPIEDRLHYLTKGNVSAPNYAPSWNDLSGGEVLNGFVVEYDIDPSCPAAEWGTFEPSLPGTSGAPVLTLSGPPVLGTTIDLIMIGSTSAFSPGVVIIGPQQTLIPAFGGHLVTSPVTTIEVVVPPVSASLRSPYSIPEESKLCGVHLTLQLLVADAGAPEGVAMSRGLNVTFGK